MIEVIKHGKHIGVGYCEKCGCSFFYHRDDDVHYNMNMDSLIYCPECGDEVIVEPGGSLTPPDIAE